MCYHKVEYNKVDPLTHTDWGSYVSFQHLLTKKLARRMPLSLSKLC